VFLPIDEFSEYEDNDWYSDWYGDEPDLAGVLWEALDDRYADADADAVEDALDDVLDSMSPAEAFGFTKALKQIERAASQGLSNPAIAKLAGAVLPTGAAALGTVIGGPAGTALGGKLGNVAAQTLGRQAPGRPGQAASAGGSAAATQALIATQQKPVLDALLRLHIGEHGKKDVNGVPVARIMSMLSSVFGEAAADADELMYLDGEGAVGADDAHHADGYGERRSLYTTVLGAENHDLADAEEW